MSSLFLSSTKAKCFVIFMCERQTQNGIAFDGDESGNGWKSSGLKLSFSSILCKALAMNNLDPLRDLLFIGDHKKIKTIPHHHQRD